MACTRCQADAPLGKHGWCAPCEAAYDTWVRRHATDIIWSVMGGGVVVSIAGILLPILGLPWIVGISAAFGGFVTIAGLQRMTQRRRRRQFLAGTALPRAYLPSKT